MEERVLKEFLDPRERMDKPDRTGFFSYVLQPCRRVLAAPRACKSVAPFCEETAQQQHWKIFTWCVTALTALGGFSLSDYSFASNFFSLFGIFCMLALIGAVGVYLLNEESVQLERNRNHLDAIRACMHKTVHEIYLDRLERYPSIPAHILRR